MCACVWRERERERENLLVLLPDYIEYEKSFLSLVLKLPIDKMTTTFDEEEGKEDDGFSETRRSSSSVPKAKVSNTRKEETLFLYRWTIVYNGILWKSHLSNPMRWWKKCVPLCRWLQTLSLFCLFNNTTTTTLTTTKNRDSPRFVSFLFSFACGDERPRRLTKDFPRFLSLSLSLEWMNEWMHLVASSSSSSSSLKMRTQTR